jgi:hypothetical protein
MEKLNYASNIIWVTMIPNYFQVKVQVHAIWSFARQEVLFHNLIIAHVPSLPANMNTREPKVNTWI